MNSDKAESVVFFSAMLVFGMGWFANAEKGSLPPAKFLIGTSVTFLGLEFISDVQPDLAAALSIAIATTAFFHYGGPLMSYINQTGGPGVKKVNVPVSKVGKPNIKGGTPEAPATAGEQARPIHMAPHA